jgi:hypothetical protein
MGEKGIYFCEICELEFHDLDEFSLHCQEEHGAVSIEVVRKNIEEKLKDEQ